MPGLGTIVNAAAIVAGGLFGLLCGKLMKPRIQESLTMACGVCVLFLGIAGAMEKMLSAAADGTLSSGGTMTLIASLVLGALIGEIINIEAAMERFGTWLRKVSHSEGDGGRRVDPGRDPRRSLNAVRKGGARPHHRYGDDRRKRQGLYFLRDPRCNFPRDDNRPLKAAGAGNDSACAR